MMTHNEFTFHLYKTAFFGQYWHGENTKGVVVLVHSMGEHATRYTDLVIPTLTNNGYGVVAFDHFGHGRTTGKRGHNPSYTAVLTSVTEAIAKAKEVFPDRPVFLYGHSMGGNTVINYLLRKTHTIQGAVATSPFLQLAFQPPGWKVSMGKILQKIAPSVTMGNELDTSHISRDTKEVQKYIADPLIHDRVSPNFSLAFMDAGRWAIEHASELQTPLFIAHGTHDKIIDHRGSVAFADKAEKATLTLYEGGYHELHNDLCKAELMTDVIDWLDSQL